jgi:Mg/Co/Ni transporter MgtE
MKLKELLEKPSKIVVENNISEDMVFSSETTESFIDRIVERLNDTVSENFLYVYVTDEKELRAVITSSDIRKLVEILRKPESKNVHDLNLDQEFPVKYVVKSTDPIQVIIDLFKKEPTDIVVITNEENQYLGKVKRSKLNEWFKIMLDPEYDPSV